MAAEFPALRANEYRDAWCGQVLPDRVDSEVRVAGWVHRRRDHGGLIFIDLRDRTGLVQLVFNPDEAGAEAFELAHKLRAEDVLSASGKVVQAQPRDRQPEACRPGEVEVRVARGASCSPTPTRRRSRSSPSRARSARRPGSSTATSTCAATACGRRSSCATGWRGRCGSSSPARASWRSRRPILTRSTPEGARDFLVPSRLQPGSFYALPQSPQLFKQLLMVGGFERYFQIARCFRDEDQRADRQPDFTQLDIEMSFVDAEDVIDLNERMLAAVLAVGGVEVELPMRRLPYDEAISRYGTDKPDLRFGLELVELTDVFREQRVQGLHAARSTTARWSAALNAGKQEFSRGDLDGFVDDAQELGAKGLVWAVVEADGWRSPVAKFLSEREIGAANEALGAAEGDVLLLVADSPDDLGGGAGRAAPPPRASAWA